jgi:mannitol/fructose-specific phosphotransferase system IIA component (Ntr-type)
MAPKDDHEAVGLSELLEEPLVYLDLHAVGRLEAVELLLDRGIEAGRVPPEDRTTILAAWAAQESQRRSDLKNGVAAPACRIDRVLTKAGLDKARCTVIAGRFPDGVDYGARDRVPVKLIFLFLIARSKFKWMAGAIADLAGLFDSGGLVAALLAAPTPVAFVESIEDAEIRLYSFDSPGLQVPRPGPPAGSPLRHAPQDDWRAP